MNQKFCTFRLLKPFLGSAIGTSPLAHCTSLLFKTWVSFKEIPKLTFPSPSLSLPLPAIHLHTFFPERISNKALSFYLISKKVTSFKNLKPSPRFSGKFSTKDDRSFKVIFGNFYPLIFFKIPKLPFSCRRDILPATTA